LIEVSTNNQQEQKVTNKFMSSKLIDNLQPIIGIVQFLIILSSQSMIIPLQKINVVGGFRVELK